MECGICQCISEKHQHFSQNALIKNWYPEKIGICNHSFCEDCLHKWIVSCLTIGNNFSCPICRFVYISHDRLYHAYNLSTCITERKNQLNN